MFAYASVRFRDTLGNNFFVALLVARVSTIFAGISNGVEKKFVAEGAENDLVELALDEFMSIHLVHLILAGTHGTLPAQTTRAIDSALPNIFFDYKKVLNRGEDVNGADTYRN
jgi:hypothetical protein